MTTLPMASEFYLKLPSIASERAGARRPAVLSIGKDRTLLHYRELVLRMAGSSVRSASPERAPVLLARRGFDLVVVCHTLTGEEQERFAFRIRHEYPGTKLIALISGWGANPMQGLFDEELHFDCGPSQLLAAVTRCLGKADRLGH